LRAKNPKIKLVGFTASPSRTDGQGLRANYDHMVVGVSAKELQRRGYLSNMRYLCPIDLVKFKRKNGDYDPDDQEKFFNDGTIVGNILKYHREEIGSKSCLVACCSLNHADTMRDRFRAAGYTAEAVRGGKKHQPHLFETLKRLEAGSLSVCCFVDVLSEGVSVNNIHGILFLRKTTSLIYYLQAIGRGLRFQEGKILTVLDFVSNIDEHGHPLAERSWTLEDVDHSTAIKKMAITRCLYCFGVFEGTPNTCPACGADLKLQRACEAAGLKVKEVEGLLVEISEDYQIITKTLINIPRKSTRMKYFKKMIHENGPTKEIYKINKLLGYKRGFVEASESHKIKTLNN
jgi:superfamily II DNA or RNA helicase